MDVLEAKQLKKMYTIGSQTVTALDSVDFVLKKGEFVAIMGPSGSGKSTLLHLIGGLDQPSDGEVYLGGQPLMYLKDKEITLLRRHNVGFVFQFFNLLPTLTAEENITLPFLIEGRNPRQYQERLESVLELIGLTERRRHKPDQLSGGEQQRVALARALITQPAVLLADEPTGNLDSKTGMTIMELLRRSCNELEQAIVVVTHDPRAASYSDRVVFLKDGQVVFELCFEPGVPRAQNISSVIEAMERLETED
jgi:putative ABC transport system ATP-binding protein